MLTKVWRCRLCGLASTEDAPDCPNGGWQCDVVDLVLPEEVAEELVEASVLRRLQ